ncbi:MAG: hypothetical protein HY341_02340, partial [Candidatus Kerfeldbacteria bacterium]|nr:hypothetical protein [Candidatus Kerfeldbacteria bacterium]
MEERQQHSARHTRIPEENILDLKALVREKSAPQPPSRHSRIPRAVAARAHSVAGRVLRRVRKLRLVRPRMPRRKERPAPAPSFAHIPVALRARHR